ncbi:MAG: hypothetical protein WC412_05720 [Candidatus Omnitrophota bacterium]
MKTKSFKIATVMVAIILVAFLIAGYCKQKNCKFVLIDAIITASVDDKFMPGNITDSFLTGTSKVYCWFQWKDAPKDTKIISHWSYVTDDVPILDYTFMIPRKNGTGSVSLEMPQGKILPEGTYHVELLYKNKKLKSLAFKVSAADVASQPVF